MRHISFLEHVVSGSGIMPDPEKIEAVNNISSPRNIKDIRSFVGLASYYRKFIPGFSSIAAPLTIDAKSGELYLDECMRTSFSAIKSLLSSWRILTLAKT